MLIDIGPSQDVRDHNDSTELTRPLPQLSERVGPHRLELLHLLVEALLLLLQVKQSPPIEHWQLRHGREIGSGPVDRRLRLQEPRVAAAVGGYVVYGHSEGEAVAGEDGDLRGDETILSQLIGSGERRDEGLHQYNVLGVVGDERREVGGVGLGEEKRDEVAVGVGDGDTDISRRGGDDGAGEGVEGAKGEGEGESEGGEVGG